MKIKFMIYGLFLLLTIFLCGCTSSKNTTPSTLTTYPTSTLIPTSTPDSNDPNMKYYQGIWNYAVNNATVNKISDPQKYALNLLQKSVDEDWRIQTSWPKFPDIDFSDGKGFQKYDKNNATFEYYRAIFNACTFEGATTSNTIADDCLKGIVQEALDNRWYDRTDWPKMPEIVYPPSS